MIDRTAPCPKCYGLMWYRYQRRNADAKSKPRYVCRGCGYWVLAGHIGISNRTLLGESPRTLEGFPVIRVVDEMTVVLTDLLLRYQRPPRTRPVSVLKQDVRDSVLAMFANDIPTLQEEYRRECLEREKALPLIIVEPTRG